MSRWMLVLVLVLTAQVSWSKNMERGPVRELAGRLDAFNPQDENYVLNNGRLAFNLTNYGYWGNDGPSQSGALGDPCDDYEGWAPQFEYPYGSGVNYLFQGALWIGAEIETDSGYVRRVSVGTDGWQNPSINEFHAGEMPGHGIVLHSNLEGAHDCFGNDIYSPSAKANYEAVAVFTDTLRDYLFVREDPFDGSHRPLGIEVTETARLWINPEYARFVILEYRVKNIGEHALRNVYLGAYVDSDVGLVGQHNEHTDDLSGSILVDSLQGTLLGWSADNDGYISSGFGGALLYPDAIGFAALTQQTELGQREFANSFNWWTSNANHSLDYGPAWLTAPEWTQELGTPEGDSHKYHLLSNRERDFDQATCAYTHTPQVDTSYACVSIGGSHEWHECDFDEIDLVTGWDTRFMLSYGPMGEFDYFDDSGRCVTRLNPGEEFTFTTAMFIGEGFHDPENPQMPPGIDTSKYDISGLIDSYQKAKRVYDSNYEFQPMPPVAELHVYQAMNEAVQLHWEEPGFGVVTGYLVSGRPDSGRGEEVTFTASPIHTTRYTVNNLTNGSWWQFVVSALDDEGVSVARDTMICVGAIPNWSVLSGRAISGRDSLWWTVSNDPHRTGYKLVRTSAVDTVVFDNISTRTFVDSDVMSGRTYSYQLYINNSLGVDGLPGNPVEMTPYAPTANILVLDDTKRPSPGEVQRGFVNGDSARAFYERVVGATGESYEYYDIDEEENWPSLEQLARYEIVFVHQDNALMRTTLEGRARETLLQEYVEIGGKVVVCGRNLFFNYGWTWPVEYDVSWVTLTFDSIFASRRFTTNPFYYQPVTTGANAIDTLFPSFEWDTSKVNSILYLNLRYPFLSEIDLMWPNGETLPIYAIELHESDTTIYGGSPCAAIGPGAMLFGFPLYFVPESTAVEILEITIDKLRAQVLDVPEPPVEPLPTSIVLHQNYPNPFNANTVIEFELPELLEVELQVFNTRGQLVTTLVSGQTAAGYHRLSFNASGFASGLYFYRLEAGDFSQTRKLLLLK